VNHRGPNRRTQTAAKETTTNMTRPSRCCSDVTTPSTAPTEAATGTPAIVRSVCVREGSLTSVETSMATIAPISTARVAGTPSTRAYASSTSTVVPTASTAFSACRRRPSPGSEATSRSRESRMAGRSRPAPASGSTRDQPARVGGCTEVDPSRVAGNRQARPSTREPIHLGPVAEFRTPRPPTRARSWPRAEWKVGGSSPSPAICGLPFPGAHSNHSERTGTLVHRQVVTQRRRTTPEEQQ